MKLFNKQAIALLICVITINALCVASVSYAYFTATIKGDGTEMFVQAGTMEITYTDSNAIKLEHAIPGDSVSKQFKVANAGTLATIYSIKLNITENTFEDKGDLLVTLKKKTQGASSFTPVFEDKALPATSGYICVNQALPLSETDTYELTIKFAKDGSDQNDNKTGKLSLTVVVDNAQNAESVIS